MPAKIAIFPSFPSPSTCSGICFSPDALSFLLSSSNWGRAFMLLIYLEPLLYEVIIRYRFQVLWKSPWTKYTFIFAIFIFRVLIRSGEESIEQEGSGRGEKKKRGNFAAEQISFICFMDESFFFSAASSLSYFYRYTAPREWILILFDVRIISNYAVPESKASLR